MKKNNVALSCKIISILILLMLVMHWQSAFIPLRIIYRLQDFNLFAIFLAVLGLLFLFLNLSAALGVYWMKNWGFAAVYTAIIFSSLFFATSYVPLVNMVFPAQYAYMSLLVINAIFLSFVIYLHVMVRRNGRPRKRKKG